MWELFAFIFSVMSLVFLFVYACENEYKIGELTKAVEDLKVLNNDVNLLNIRVTKLSEKKSEAKKELDWEFSNIHQRFDRVVDYFEKKIAEVKIPISKKGTALKKEAIKKKTRKGIKS